MAHPKQSAGKRIRRPAGLLHTLLAPVLLLSTWTTALGQDHAPPDVGVASPPEADGGVTEVRLPEPPDDYLTERRGGVEWTFPAAATSEVRELMDVFGDSWARIEEDLGGPIDDTLTIRVARDPDEMHELSPVGHPPPEYASGVAYPPFGVILLSLTAPESWERPDMEALLTHELSHVALHRAVEGHRVPRWFGEGLAIYQAGEQSLDRVRTLWSASVAGNVVPLDRLSESFPSRPHRVNVAYAQSADMVAFLRRDARDARSFRILVRNVRDGMPFEEAVRQSYDATLGTLEDDWRASLDERFQAIPLVVTGGGLWVLLSVLIVVAWVRRRRKDRARLRRWAQEEAAEKDALARTERALADKLAARDEEERILVPDEPPQGRESDVPTIEYEGRNHTLH